MVHLRLKSCFIHTGKILSIFAQYRWRFVKGSNTYKSTRVSQRERIPQIAETSEPLLKSAHLPNTKICQYQNSLFGQRAK